MTMNEQFKDPHVLADRIFMEILPEKGMTVRENQIKLCHAMLDAMMHHNIALCDAGTGIGKTYSYLVAGLIKSRYEAVKSPVLISTSSIALQNAIIKEYVPFLSDALTEYGIIDKPLRAVVRKGKNRYVCDRRLSERLRGIDHSKKNRQQRNALISLTQTIDLDSVVDLSEFDKVRVHVEHCSKCRYAECRYRSFIKQSKSPAYDFQICNHNLLIADALHRREGLRPVLPEHCALKLHATILQAMNQMLGNRDAIEDNLKQSLAAVMLGERSGLDMIAVQRRLSELNEQQAKLISETAERGEMDEAFLENCKAVNDEILQLKESQRSAEQAYVQQSETSGRYEAALSAMSELPAGLQEYDDRLVARIVRQVMVGIDGEVKVEFINSAIKAVSVC